MKPHHSLCALMMSLLGACTTPQRVPLTTVAHVDLERFMGDWHVIAAIPTALERNAYNAMESYRLAADGSIDTTFTYRAGGFDGPVKRYRPRGFVRDPVSRAVWGMRFVWPWRADYRIVYLSADYSQTIIGRQKRDYAWIMARSASLPESDYQRLVAILAHEGYDTARLRKVPQRWPAP